MNQAQPPLEFIPPDFNPAIWSLARSILPLWLRYREQITEVRSENMETLIELYQQFQNGDTRFLLAFRHPSTSDPLVISQLLWNQLPQAAKKQGKSLKSPVHAHFVYDRGIPLWAGKGVGWLIPKLGGTPIRRGALDRQGLRSIRDLFATGALPMAAAPEGATNGHNEIVSPIEPGIAQFGFWCVEDLQAAGNSAQVKILPLGVRYYFVEAPWQSLEKLLSQLEIDSGCREVADGNLALINGVEPTPEVQAILYRRLYGLGEHLLSLMEGFYRKFYQQSIVDRSELTERLPALLNNALNVAEAALGLNPKGTISDRCRRVEQAGWDRIYRQDLKDLDTLAPAMRGLANLVASEAQLRLWHMRLVENFVSVTGHYVAEKPTVERFADTILLLWQTIQKLKQKSPNKPPFLGKKWVKLTVAPPLDPRDYWNTYQSNRRQAVTDLTTDLQAALEELARF
jgi:hypothetical protein